MILWRWSLVLVCLMTFTITMIQASVEHLAPTWEEQDPLPWKRRTLEKVPASHIRSILNQSQTDEALRTSKWIVKASQMKAMIMPKEIRPLASHDGVCLQRVCELQYLAQLKHAATTCSHNFNKGVDRYRSLLSSEAKIITKNDGQLYTAANNYIFARNEAYNFQKPVAIIYLGAETDATVVIQIAQASKCHICTRSGGHDSSGASICTGGIVVDTSGLSNITVHAADKYAVIQAGARWNQILPAVSAQGLLGVSGVCPTVCLAGYSLGGGWGVLSKSQGMSCDNVLAYTVAISTSSELVVADADGPYSDLFWALRGAGHTSYGIVTSIKYRLFEKRTTVQARIVFNATREPRGYDNVTNALYYWQENYLDKPPLTLALFPTLGKVGNAYILRFSAFLDTAAVGAAAVREMTDLIQPLASQPGGSVAFVNVIDLGAPSSGNTTETQIWQYKRGQYVTRPLTLQEYHQLVQGCLYVPIGYTDTLPTSESSETNYFSNTCYIEPVEGLMARRSPTDMAFSHRSVGFDMVSEVSINPAHKGSQQAAVRYQNEAYDKWWKGIVGPTAYQNYPYIFYNPPAAALEAYYSPNLCRLVALKAKYDPSNVFGSQQQGIPAKLIKCTDP